MKIEILGTGCPKCKKMFENTQQALIDLNIAADLSKVEDINKIINAGVMMTPAIAIDGDVKSAGKLLSVDEIKKLVSCAGSAPGSN